MAKTSNIFARVEPDIKADAELILTELGIPMSAAVSMFLKQVVINRGIPFDIKLPAKTPISAGTLTADEINFELNKGLDDINNGRIHSLENVINEMKRDYGI